MRDPPPGYESDSQDVICSVKFVKLFDRFFPFTKYPLSSTRLLADCPDESNERPRPSRQAGSSLPRPFRSAAGSGRRSTLLSRASHRGAVLQIPSTTVSTTRHSLPFFFHFRPIRAREKTPTRRCWPCLVQGLSPVQEPNLPIQELAGYNPLCGSQSLGERRNTPCHRPAPSPTGCSCFKMDKVPPPSLSGNATSVAWSPWPDRV